MQALIYYSLRSGIRSKVCNWQNWFIVPILAFVGLTLFAIFTLAAWAEASPLHHATQHVIIFIAGAGCGASFVLLKRRGSLR